MNKRFTFVLVLILVSSNLIVVKPAQSAITKPSVPEFTLKFVGNSYDVPPTYGVDPYTGKNITIQEGHHVENKSIEVAIKNQPFTSYRNENNSLVGLFYSIRVKGHFEDWHGEPSSENYIYRSDSDYTVVAYSHRLEGISAGGQVDFQVQALIGYYTHINDTIVPGVPRFDPTDPPHHYVFTGEASGWSDTQTVTVNGLIFGVETIVILEVLVIAIVLGVIVGLLVYFKKRKPKA